MSLSAAIRNVRTFHQRIGAHVSTQPMLLPCRQHAARWLALQIRDLIHVATEGSDGATDLLLSRLAMTLEEIAEWLEAHADQDIEAAADAWADRAYLLMGDAVAAGLPGGQLFEEVHRSNMTKAPGIVTGTGNAVKQGTYEPPRITRILDGNGESGWRKQFRI